MIVGYELQTLKATFFIRKYLMYNITENLNKKFLIMESIECCHYADLSVSSFVTAILHH